MYNDQIHSHEQRLSPNIFLNLNFDSVAEQSNGLTFEWSTGGVGNSCSSNQQQQIRNEQYPPKILTPPPSAVLSSTDPHSTTYDDMRYLNVDHFSILNLDQSILGAYPVDDVDKINHCLDIHQYSLADDNRNNQDILELERPLNINISLASVDDNY